MLERLETALSADHFESPRDEIFDWGDDMTTLEITTAPSCARCNRGRSAFGEGEYAE